MRGALGGPVTPSCVRFPTSPRRFPPRALPPLGPVDGHGTGGWLAMAVGGHGRRRQRRRRPGVHLVHMLVHHGGDVVVPRSARRTGAMLAGVLPLLAPHGIQK